VNSIARMAGAVHRGEGSLDVLDLITEWTVNSYKNHIYDVIFLIFKKKLPKVLPRQW
jgi:bisphosphoglycerate-independent phosphoglycerate mutase (AlkP superfamily)